MIYCDHEAWLSDSIFNAYVQMSSTLFHKAGAYEMANLHTRLYNSNTYFYSFEYEGSNSKFDDMFNGDPPFDGGKVGVPMKSLSQEI